MGVRAGAATRLTAWPAEPPPSCPHCLGQASVPRDSRKQVADSGKLLLKTKQHKTNSPPPQLNGKIRAYGTQIQ